MAFYIKVVKNESSDEITEFPLEDDLTLEVETLQSQYPQAIGLKYKSESGAWRAMKVNGGIISAPGNQWDKEATYVATYDNKRKADDANGGRGSKAGRSADGSEKPMDVIVLNMPFHTTESDMKTYFSKYGPLTFVQLKLKEDGSSRGFGFIRFEKIEDQYLCLEDEHKFGDRVLNVKLPQSKVGGFHEFQSDGNKLTRRIHVGNVAQTVTKKELTDAFTPYGRITDVFIPRPTDRVKNPNYAFLTFERAEDARDLVESGDVVELNGETLLPSYASPMAGKGGVAEPRNKEEAMGMAMAMMKKFMKEDNTEEGYEEEQEEYYEPNYQSGFGGQYGGGHYGRGRGRKAFGGRYGGGYGGGYGVGYEEEYY